LTTTAIVTQSKALAVASDLLVVSTERHCAWDPDPNVKGDGDKDPKLSMHLPTMDSQGMVGCEIGSPICFENLNANA